MDIVEEAWRLVSEWRKAITMETDDGFGLGLKACAEDLEDILIENAKVKKAKVSETCQECFWLTDEKLCGHYADTFLDKNNKCGLFAPIE
jgi:hypothetical protein